MRFSCGNQGSKTHFEKYSPGALMELIRYVEKQLYFESDNTIKKVDEFELRFKFIIRSESKNETDWSLIRNPNFLSYPHENRTKIVDFLLIANI